MGLFQKEIESIRDAGLYRTLRRISSSQDTEITIDGRQVLNFCSNNYLGLANDPRVVEGGIEALQRYGAGSGAARLISGNFDINEELETELARFKGTEAALLFNSGYHANIGVIPALAGEGDVIFSDELNHASLIDGCRLSRAETAVYRHNDLDHLEELLKGRIPLLCKEGLGEVDQGTTPPSLPLWFDKLTILSKVEGQRGGRKLIVTEAVFSMEGDLCPLNDLRVLAEKYDAMIYLDEAHAVGILGSRGQGLLEAAHPRVISMGTLGKAFGAYGAFVAGSKSLREYLINKARSFIFSTALPPAAIGAARAALKIIQEEPERRKQLWDRVLSLQMSLRSAEGGEAISRMFSGDGHALRARHDTCVVPPDPTTNISPIVSIRIGDAKKTMALSQKLLEEGIYLQGIRPPTVPEGTSRLRLTVMATHQEEQLQKLVQAVGGLISYDSSVRPS